MLDNTFNYRLISTFLVIAVAELLLTRQEVGRLGSAGHCKHICCESLGRSYSFGASRSTFFFVMQVQMQVAHKLPMCSKQE